MDRDWANIIFLGIAFGSAMYLNELMLRDMGPFYAALGRVGPAALVSWLFLILFRRGWRMPVRLILPVAVLGFFFFWVPMVAFPVGQQYLESSLVGIINAMTPVFTVIVSHLWPKGERATRLKVMGVLVGFAGIVILTLPSFEPGAENRLFGTIIVLSAPLSFAIGLNWVRQISGVSSIVMITWAFTFAATALLPLVIFGDPVPAVIQPTTWLVIFASGVIMTGFLFQYGFAVVLPRAGPTKTSTLTFIAPITALLLGTWLLGERLVLEHYLGMAAIFAGLFLIDGSLFRRKTA